MCLIIYELFNSSRQGCSGSEAYNAITLCPIDNALVFSKLAWYNLIQNIFLIHRLINLSFADQAQFWLICPPRCGKKNGHAPIPTQYNSSLGYLHTKE
jgi:hypothetical protein